MPQPPSYANERLRGTSLPPILAQDDPASPRPPPRSRRGSRRGSLLSLDQIGQPVDPEQLGDKLKAMGSSTMSLKEFHPVHTDPKTDPKRPPRRRDVLRKGAISRNFKNLSVICEDVTVTSEPSVLSLQESISIFNSCFFQKLP